MTKAGARLFLHAGFATAALLLFAAASSRAETLDQFYEKAKLEKTLVFYSGGPAAPHENRAKEFMQKYPGIAVSVTGGFSNVLNEGIERQIADRKLEVDMAFKAFEDMWAGKKPDKLLLDPGFVITQDSLKEKRDEMWGYTVWKKQNG